MAAEPRPVPFEESDAVAAEVMAKQVAEVTQVPEVVVNVEARAQEEELAELSEERTRRLLESLLASERAWELRGASKGNATSSTGAPQVASVATPSRGKKCSEKAEAEPGPAGRTREQALALRKRALDAAEQLRLNLQQAFPSKTADFGAIFRGFALPRRRGSSPSREAGKGGG